MGCRQCSGKPSVPYERPGIPTVYAWGPFPDHEAVDYADLESYGYSVQEEES